MCRANNHWCRSYKITLLYDLLCARRPYYIIDHWWNCNNRISLYPFLNGYNDKILSLYPFSLPALLLQKWSWLPVKWTQELVASASLRVNIPQEFSVYMSRICQYQEKQATQPPILYNQWQTLQNPSPKPLCHLWPPFWICVNFLYIKSFVLIILWWPNHKGLTFLLDIILTYFAPYKKSILEMWKNNPTK